MLNNNFVALIITFLSAIAWLRINDYAAQRGWISSHLSRKIIHVGTGPLFVICWLLFDEAVSARFLAALVPLFTSLNKFLENKDDPAALFFPVLPLLIVLIPVIKSLMDGTGSKYVKKNKSTKSDSK